MRYFLLLVFCSSLSCQTSSDKPDATAEPADPALFTLLSPDETGVTFANNLDEGPNTNVLMYEYFYNGGGVAVGDLNNDGLDDIYFTGNMVPNQLYINGGNLTFTDATTPAGVAGRDGPWTTGVTMADVNGDGKLDLYVCHSGSVRPENRLPELFINDGNDANGIPHFTDRTAEYGLAQPTQSTQGVFFDYDRDGDLDLFQLNHNPRLLPILDPAATASLLKKPDPEIGVRLYRNTNNHFTDVTEKAGLSSSVLSYGLGVGVSDLNNDGWPDVYVSNDYGVPDYLYLNEQNGHFRDALKTSVGHTSNFSMGNDIADVNNDGRPDIMTLDMLPEYNRRQKLLMAPDNYDKYALSVASGFHHQIMRNMLQLNLGGWGGEEGGRGEKGRRGGEGEPHQSLSSPSSPSSFLPVFSEVGQLAGVSNTDWSWAPLLADYDNDGWKDLYITNGSVRDFTNLDFLKYMTDFMQNRPASPTREDVLELVRKTPSSNVANYMFRNRGKGNAQFTPVGASWGLRETSNSTGAAYADLDIDGDLDLIVSNANQPAFIYRNDARDPKKTPVRHHYLAVKLAGAGANTQGLGAKLTLYQPGNQQYLEQMPTRGFQSSVSPRLHFGLGQNARIDSLRIVWPTGKTQLLTSPNADQLLTLREADARQTYRIPTPAPALFRETKSPIAFTDPVVTTNDFKRQPLMVNAQSFGGPCMTKADVNGDGLDDVFVGGGSGQAGALLLGQKSGGFSRNPQPAFDADKACVDADAVFFDADGDTFLDLYVCSGGYGDLQPNDRNAGSPNLQDRLYLNDRKGNFLKTKGLLPVMLTSTACVRVADVNGDGRPDLFVGGRVVPGRYPEPPRSYLLVNDRSGTFTDKTAQLAPMLASIGMVTDAAWTDLNRDQKPELVVVGEWMPITVLTLTDGKLRDETTAFLGKSQPDYYRGWWNKLLVDDLNGDGRPDLVIGNQGLNTQCRASGSHPAELVYKDFDNNGKIDPVLSLYVQGKPWPHASRDELFDQIPMLKKRFTTYDAYANATLTDLFTADELSDAKRLTANELKTMYLVSTPAGKLVKNELPMAAQVAPVFTITSLDYDRDGHNDLLLCGNAHQARLRFGRSDANFGVLLKNDGRGNFVAVPQQQSGFRLTGDVRSVLAVGNLLLFGINQQPVRAYSQNASTAPQRNNVQ